MEINKATILSGLLLMLCCMELTSAATWLEYLPELPEKFKDKKGCYIKETDDVIKFGEQITPPIGYCYSIACSESYIHYASCAVVSTDDSNCYVTEIDLKYPHPECCPQIKCDTNHLN